MNQLLLAIILSVLPLSELRGGLPIAVNYCLNNNVPILPVFLLIVIVNIAVIFLLFFFLDYLHKYFMKIPVYQRLMGFVIERTRKKAEKVKKQMDLYGYFALALFVAVPLPLTGAWTGTLVAWFLGLERKKSILAISAGVFIAGLIILIGSWGILRVI
ncbi:small multi-drug export protein [Candidatus Pacearchaeota archaeon]|nr:small multi-drug export protein [Candidatus Pacearchaeota archaeon]